MDRSLLVSYLDIQCRKRNSVASRRDLSTRGFFQWLRSLSNLQLMTQWERSSSDRFEEETE